VAVRRLLTLLRAAPEEAARLVAPWQDEEWSAVVAQAERRSLAPLLYDRMQRMAIAVSEGQMQRLRRQYLATAAANLRRSHLLGGTLTSLRAAGIRVALLKGAHLAPLVYGNEALRPMADTDLLVQEQEAGLALEILAESGYDPVSGQAWMGERYGHYALRHCETGLLLELHARLAPFEQRGEIDQAALWDRMLPATVAGERVWTLCPVDLLVYLSIHAASQHLLQMGLLPLFDLAALCAVSGGEIEAQELALRAREWGGTRATWLALTLARDLAGARVPDAFTQALGAAATPGLLADLCEQLLREPGQAGGAPSPNLMALWAAPDWRTRLRTWGRILHPEAAHMRALYRLGEDEPVSGLLYLRRLSDLIFRRKATLRGLLGRTRETPYEALARWLADG